MNYAAGGGVGAGATGRRWRKRSYGAAEGSQDAVHTADQGGSQGVGAAGRRGGGVGQLAKLVVQRFVVVGVLEFC